ncbi:hypothetical protein COU79_05090 [Candidatus Peregrinibacteria bacterium CG10_big_fil_rev_8_21_14_0_10_54_7]|nr:MAG: hypothetical protein COU79_05090 [Candidatus Peregrinibacteria bacterium CG10_big_fil_rev_8_21_14_0_10_54_7]
MDTFIQVDRQEDHLLFRANFNLVAYRSEKALEAVEEVLHICDTPNELDEFGQRRMDNMLEKRGLLQQQIQLFRMRTPFEVYRTIRERDPEHDDDVIWFTTTSDGQTTVEVSAAKTTQVDIRTHPPK